MGEYFTPEDIAMAEHELMSENEILEWRPDDAVWYLSGVHEMAMKLMQKFKKEGES